MKSIPLDGLGMNITQMLELVNRLNTCDDRKWILQTKTTHPYCQQMQNVLNPLANMPLGTSQCC